MTRLLLNLCLICMFTLVQTGVATHGISHIEINEQHALIQTEQDTDQQDHNQLAEHCGQCIAYAKIDGGLPNTFVFELNQQATFQVSTQYVAHLRSVITPAFVARAPPNNLNLLA